MKLARVFALIATTLPLVAGCGGSSGVPRADGSADYETLKFRDDAAANAAVPDGGFPESFTDSAGVSVDLKQYRGAKLVVVVLRGVPRSWGGGFCPSCLAQAGSLAANRAEFDRRKVEVLVLFPGPAERLGEFLQTAKRQTPGEPDGRFRMLLDPDRLACDRLGIRADLAKPSTYVLDSRGRVTYAYVGETSTDRPSVKAVLAQLDRAE